MRRVTAHLNKYIEALEKTRVPGVSPAHLNTFKRLYELAMREPTEEVMNMRCPKCRKTHIVETVECEHCGDIHPITIPSAQMEKNSIACLLKLSDKFAPNLAAVTQDINVNFLVSNIQEFCVKLITKYVPEKEKLNVISELKTTMSKVVEAEYEEVNDGK